MQFAMYVPNFDTFGSVHTLVTLAQAAKTAGWDGFFLWEHLVAARLMGQPNRGG